MESSFQKIFSILSSVKEILVDNKHLKQPPSLWKSQFRNRICNCLFTFKDGPFITNKMMAINTWSRRFNRDKIPFWFLGRQENSSVSLGFIANQDTDKNVIVNRLCCYSMFHVTWTTFKFSRNQHGVINVPIKSLAKNYSPKNFTVGLRTTK